MPLLTREDGIEIFWEERGSDSGPSVILAPYCISHPSVFDPLEAELATNHRIVRYDDRGSGASTHRGPYDMETGAADLEAVLEAAGGAAVVVALADCVNRAVAGDREPTRPGGGARRPGRQPGGPQLPRGHRRDGLIGQRRGRVHEHGGNRLPERGAHPRHRRKPADQRGRGPGAGRAAGRRIGPRTPPRAACRPGRRTTRRTPGASAAIGCGSCTPTTRAGAGSPPATKAGTSLAAFSRRPTSRGSRTGS